MCEYVGVLMRFECIVTGCGGGCVGCGMGVLGVGWVVLGVGLGMCWGCRWMGECILDK